MTKIVKLSDICIKITDGSHYSPEGVIKGFPMFSVKDMRDNGFSYDDCKYISAEEFENMKANGCVPQINDILIAKDGSYLKHIFIVTENKDEAVLSSIGILRPNSELVNPYYIKYYLSSDFVKEQVAKKYVSGSALPRIILKNFANIEIPMINMELQNKIVNVLKSIDDKIENNNRINAELESMAKTIYDYWFLQFEFPNEDGKPYKSSGGKMVWNEELKREIPESWEVKVIEDFCRIFTGKKDVNQALESGEYKFFSCSPEYKYSNEKLHSGKAILVSGNGSYTGRTIFVNDSFDLYQRTYACVSSTDKDLLEYIYYSMLRVFTQKVGGGTHGSAIPYIVFDDIAKEPVLYNADIVEKYQKIVIPLQEKIIKNQRENEELTSLRDFLLPMLMNGQIGFKDGE